ncbi:hypothetical protein [Methylobacterium thuringiense]|uniref:Uncharacterized protein n=1 Tax=Methylobacterium thuringiense TaxID=1003091 RepID=A0ABQ4TP25_9HYPH|nr:hypothetical protein [Methylobacterium thuringiense]GJE56741.1 hypothetical protein EKPJFOCH_3249 [Methylobacterium thuringiense]
MTRRPDSVSSETVRDAAGSLFRAGIGVRLVAALALSAVLWAAILWASA